ncbi:hypothetical protein ACVW04_004381 [Bradyrhizobium sp. LM2.3]
MRLKAGGELADLVLGRDSDGLVEPARLDLAGASQQQPHRTRDAATDQQRKSESDDRREQGHDARNDHRLTLTTYHLRCAGKYLLQHVGADRIDLLIELIAQQIEMFQRAARFRHLFAIDLLKEFCVVLVQVTAQLGDGGLDAGLDPRQRGIVGGRSGIVDNRVDELARAFGLLLDPAVGFLELAKARRIGLFVRRRLHLGHDHAPQCECPFQRSDVGACQMAIGRDVAIGQLVEQDTDLARHHHRQDRGDQHQDDQSEGDADDLAPDRLVEKWHGYGAKAERMA